MDLHNTWPERKGTVTKRAGSMRSTLHELQPRTLIFVWGGWSKSNPSRIWRPILEPPLASPHPSGCISPRLSRQSPNPLPSGIAMEPNYISPEEWSKTVGEQSAGNPVSRSASLSMAETSATPAPTSPTHPKSEPLPSAEWANTVGQLLAERSEKKQQQQGHSQFTLTDDLRPDCHQVCIYI
jgi:hypothetical protein